MVPSPRSLARVSWIVHHRRGRQPTCGAHDPDLSRPHDPTADLPHPPTRPPARLPNSIMDVRGMQMGDLVLVHGFQERHLYGLFRCTNWRVMQDKEPMAHGRFRVYLSPLKELPPVPEMMATLIVARRVDAKRGHPLRHLDRKLDRDKVQAAWRLFHFWALRPYAQRRRAGDSSGDEEAAERLDARRRLRASLGAGRA